MSGHGTRRNWQARELSWRIGPPRPQGSKGGRAAWAWVGLAEPVDRSKRLEGDSRQDKLEMGLDQHHVTSMPEITASNGSGQGAFNPGAVGIQRFEFRCGLPIACRLERLVFSLDQQMQGAAAFGAGASRAQRAGLTVAGRKADMDRRPAVNTTGIHYRRANRPHSIENAADWVCVARCGCEGHYLIGSARTGSPSHPAPRRRAQSGGGSQDSTLHSTYRWSFMTLCGTASGAECLVRCEGR
jgi:hypothetical protein